MTPEQKQLEQIQERWSGNAPFPSLRISAFQDIQFLLSLVKSQAAGAGIADDLPYRIVEEMGLGLTFRSCTCGQLPCARLQPLRNALETIATSMRSACVEKVKETHDSVESACNAVLMDVYDLSIANAPIPAKDCREIADCIGDRVGQIRKAIAALTEALESLSTEQPKE